MLKISVLKYFLPRLFQAVKGCDLYMLRVLFAYLSQGTLFSKCLLPDSISALYFTPERQGPCVTLLSVCIICPPPPTE